MQITDYFNLQGQDLSFARQQGSDFAKKIANDFNPIHDVDHKRFCVPGDLLFSVMLHHYGLRKKMNFTFSGMVDESKTIILPKCDSGESELESELAINDANDKTYVSIKCEGESTYNADLIKTLSESYVQFSGRAFPHILVPLMRDNKVMINPDRPLMMYQSMSLSLDTLDLDDVRLEVSSNKLRVNGKRGEASLNYVIKSNDKVIGKGQKKMLLSGLREYDAEKMDAVVAYYDDRKNKLG